MVSEATDPNLETFAEIIKWVTVSAIERTSEILDMKCFTPYQATNSSWDSDLQRSPVLREIIRGLPNCNGSQPMESVKFMIKACKIAKLNLTPDALLTHKVNEEAYSHQ